VVGALRALEAARRINNGFLKRKNEHFLCRNYEIRCSIMLRLTVYVTIIVFLTSGAASAQNDLRDVQGGENSWRTGQEKKNDRAIDCDYKATMNNSTNGVLGNRGH
jgi:hypothetical protein